MGAGPPTCVGKISKGPSVCVTSRYLERKAKNVWITNQPWQQTKQLNMSGVRFSNEHGSGKADEKHWQIHVTKENCLFIRPLSRGQTKTLRTWAPSALFPHHSGQTVSAGVPNLLWMKILAPAPFAFTTTFQWNQLDGRPFGVRTLCLCTKRGGEVWWCEADGPEHFHLKA